MTEITFGSCNHHFTKGRSSAPSYNLLKIYPDENTANIAYLGENSEIPITSTIQYCAKPPQRPPRLKKVKALHNAESSKLVSQPSVDSQTSIDEKTIFCCLPKSPKKNSKDKKEHNNGEKPP